MVSILLDVPKGQPWGSSVRIKGKFINHKELTFNALKFQTISSFTSKIFQKFLLAFDPRSVGAHGRHAKRRHRRHPHSTHRRWLWWWGRITSTGSWHWWCRQSKWEQLGIHILQIIENISSTDYHIKKSSFSHERILTKYLLSNYILLLLFFSFLLILCLNFVLDKLIYLTSILSNKLFKRKKKGIKRKKFCPLMNVMKDTQEERKTCKRYGKAKSIILLIHASSRATSGRIIS